MIAVRCFSLCVVNSPTDLNWLNPVAWAQNIPDLQHITIAGELRGCGIVQMMPKDVSHSWLPKRRPLRSRDGFWASHAWALEDTMDVLNFSKPRQLLVLPSDRAHVLAMRLDSFKQPTLMPGTLWTVQPRREVVYFSHPNTRRWVPYNRPTYQFMFLDPKPVLTSQPQRHSTVRQQRTAAAAAKLAAE